MKRRAHGAVWWVGGTAAAVAAVWGAVVLARPMVTVTEAVQGPVVQAFYATGTVCPEHEYPVRNNVAGILTDVMVDRGQKVRKGEVLARIANDELLFKLKQSQAELEEQRQRADEKTSPVLEEYDARMKALGEMLEIARREEARVGELVGKSAATAQDMDQAMDRTKTIWSDLEAERAQRRAKELELGRELEVAKAAVEIAQWDCDQEIIRSPIDGVVLDWPATKGTRLAVNDHLMQVADVTPGKLIMRAEVDEEDKTEVRVGQTVRMTLYSFAGRIFTGRVARVYDKADPDRRTFEVDVELTDKDEGLAAGMTGEMAFVISAKDRATVVPSQAVQEGRVWAVREGRLVKTDAVVGLKSVERVEILSGLEAGEQVVISPVGTLSEGQMVRTRRVDPVAAAGLNRPEVEEGKFKGFGG